MGLRKRLGPLAPGFSLALVVLVVGMYQHGLAQGPSYGIGRAPTAEEVRAWDISISPTGKELPAGRGTAKEGAQLFIQKGCAGCHGKTGSGGQAPVLIRSTDTSMSGMTCLAPCVNNNNTMALHSPYATVIWDYINRGMPLGKEGSLKPDEVYALTAFILFKSDVVKEDEVIDQQSLPKVKMPNQNGYAMPPEWKHGEPRLAGYP